MDAGQRPRDLARDEGLAAQRRFVVEQDAVAGVQAVGLAIIDGDPVGVNLGGAVGRARVERRGLALRNLLNLAEHLGGRGLVEAGLALEPQDADRLEHSQRADRIRVRGVFGRFERHCHVALRRQVVDLVRLDLLDDADEIGRVGQIPVMKLQPHVRLVRILIQMIDAIGIEGGRAALDAVDVVALREQQFGQIRAILAGNAGDQRCLRQFNLRKN